MKLQNWSYFGHDPLCNDHTDTSTDTNKFLSTVIMKRGSTLSPQSFGPGPYLFLFLVLYHDRYLHMKEHVIDVEVEDVEDTVTHHLHPFS